ncbi:MAG: hypothetical protein ACLU9S_07390 [Oscillospiraceae bacterium]
MWKLPAGQRGQDCRKLWRYLLTIKAKAEDIDRMVSQLFLFSKLDMAEYPMEPRTLRLDEFVTDLAAETAGE